VDRPQPPTRAKSRAGSGSCYSVASTQKPPSPPCAAGTRARATNRSPKPSFSRYSPRAQATKSRCDARQQLQTDAEASVAEAQRRRDEARREAERIAQQRARLERECEPLRRYGEPEIVCNAVGAHHRDIEPTSLEAHVVIATDSISAARPGARRESLQQYLRHMQEQERIAMSFEGVEKVDAIQARREVRVLVKPNEVDDLRAHQLAREIAHKIQSELEYPGQVKVTVIREVRGHHVAH